MGRCIRTYCLHAITATVSCMIFGLPALPGNRKRTKRVDSDSKGNYLSYFHKHYEKHTTVFAAILGTFDQYLATKRQHYTTMTTTFLIAKQKQTGRHTNELELSARYNY